MLQSLRLLGFPSRKGSAAAFGATAGPVTVLYRGQATFWEIKSPFFRTSNVVKIEHKAPFSLQPYTMDAVPASAPHRVASLLPAATEILALIGGESLLVGRGHEDDFPSSVKSRPVITAARTKFTTSAEVDKVVNESLSNGSGLYELHEDRLKELRPTVILTQSLCSVCAISEGMVFRIAKEIEPQPAVVSLSPDRIEDIIADVIKVGKAVGLEDEARGVADSLHRRLEAGQKLVRQRANGRAPRVVFMEWTEPIFCGGHWTPQLIEMAGGQHPLNPCKNGGGAGDSFRVSPAQVVEADPDWVIVCPCGLDIPTTKRELAEVAQRDWWKGLRAVKAGKVVLVDGNQMFNRSGPRLVDAFEWLVGLLNNVPAIMPSAFPWETWTQVSSLQAAPLPSTHSPPTDKPAQPTSRSASTSDMDGAASTPGSTSRGHGTGAVPARAASSHGNGGTAGSHEEAEGEDDAIGGVWSAPVLTPDVEEAHAAAVAKGRQMYADPKTGYSVFTAQNLKSRGTCCGNQCRHCPYGHFNVPSWKRRDNVIQEPIFITTNRIQRTAMEGKGKSAMFVLYWTGGVASLLSLKALLGELRLVHPTPADPVPQIRRGKVSLVAAFDSATGKLLAPSPSSQGSKNEIRVLPISIRAVMEQCLQLKLPLLAIPVEASRGMEELHRRVTEEFKLVPGKVEALVLPDTGSQLPEEEEWQASLQSSGVLTWRPLIGQPSAHLLDQLFSFQESDKVKVIVRWHKGEGQFLKEASIETLTRDSISKLPLEVDPIGHNSRCTTFVQFSPKTAPLQEG